MKKLRVIFLLLTVIAISASLHAQTTPLQLGVRISSSAPVVNSSVSLRYFMRENRAIEGLVSFSPVAIGGLYEVFKPLSAAGLSWFYGGGAYVAFKKPNRFGAQGILGLDYNFATIPVNLSVDWKPELSIINVVNFEPAAVGVSARFTIK